MVGTDLTSDPEEFYLLSVWVESGEDIVNGMVPIRCKMQKPRQNVPAEDMQQACVIGEAPS